MFENMNEQQAREEILKTSSLPLRDKYHNTKKEFKEETVFHTRHVFMTARRW